MRKFFLYFMITMIFVVGHSNCKAQGQDYKVTWANEQILPYEDAGLPNVSSNGQKVVFIRYRDNSSEIWTINSDGSHAKVLLSEPHTDFSSPIWFPDGSKIAYLKNGDFEMWKISADGRLEGPLTEKKYEKISPVFTLDGTKLIFGLLGINPPGIYALDLTVNKQNLIYSTTTFANLNPPFTVSPDSTALLILNGQELIILNVDGTVRERKTVNTHLKGDEDPVWTPDGRYILLGNLLYVLATGEEVPFLPDEVVRYREPGKPDLVGPSSITLSKDGKKIAFMMVEPNTEIYRARIKIMDLVWK